MKTYRSMLPALILLLLLSASLSQAQTQPTVAETQEWIISKMGVIANTGQCPSRQLALATDDFVWRNSCTLEFVETNMEMCEPRFTTTERWSIPLGSLDPEKVEFSCPGRSEGCVLELHATNGEEKLPRLQQSVFVGKPGVDWEKVDGPSDTPSYYARTRLVVKREEGIGPRIQSAFTFLIKKCGGRPSRPEPF